MILFNRKEKQFMVSDGFEWFWKTFENGTWEPHTFEIFDKFIKSDSIVFDIGAWIGPTALYASRLAEEVYAFEPDPVAFNQLRMNALLNNRGNLEVQNIAMAPADGKMEIGMRNEYGDSMSSVLWKKNTIQVDCEDVNAWMEDKKPDFIKIDIEGGEFTLLPSMKTYLDERKPTLYLSMHVEWFLNQKEYLEAMCDVLSVYPYLYDDRGTAITLADILSADFGFNAVVATTFKN